MATADTIVALATPQGSGGIAVIRLSGPDVPELIPTLTGKTLLPRVATVVTLKNANGDPVDHGLGLYFPAPHSFTGEAVFEFHGHGGPVVSESVVSACVDAGARRAQPGEFSRRAFENDKLDLAQAEAIADLIASGSEEAARAALRSLNGEFSARVNELAEAVTRVRIWVEAAIDFPDEEIDFLSDAGLQRQLADLDERFRSLEAAVTTGQVLTNGFRVVIAGKPNAGKSSLMNALSGDDTAIVTDIAGTTRDVLRETIQINGLTVDLVDTAGLRDDPDTIEEEGIRRARRAMESADAVLWLVDSTDNSAQAPDTDRPTLVVYNKVDLVDDTPEGIAISAKTGAGLDALRSAISELAGYRPQAEGAFSARRRHVEALQRARGHFDAGREALRLQAAGELLAEELKLAQEALSEMTGAVSSDDLLGRIFSDFCIGK